MKSKNFMFAIGMIAFLLVSLIAPVFAYFIEEFESGITDFWVEDTNGTGTVDESTESRYGSLGLNATGWGIAGANYAFIWTDNITTSEADYNYMGYWIKFDSDFILSNTKSVYLSSMWDEFFTWNYLHVINSSGSLRWYPNQDQVVGSAIQLDTWYWVVQGYFINDTGWERLWVTETLIYDNERDTHDWSYNTGISVGVMNIYGLVTDGGSIYFDHVCHDSSMLYPSPPFESWLDLYFMFAVGMVGIGMMIFSPTWWVLLVKKKGVDENVIERGFYAILFFVVGYGFFISWLVS